MVTIVSAVVLFATIPVVLALIALLLLIAVVHALTYGPIAGFTAELFPPRLRY